LAALMPLEAALVLVKLRWPAEVRGLEALELGTAVTKAKLAKSELDMAKRLIKDMSGEWQPEDDQASVQDRIAEPGEQKANAGKPAAAKPKTGSKGGSRKTAKTARK